MSSSSALLIVWSRHAKHQLDFHPPSHCQDNRQTADLDVNLEWAMDVVDAKW